MIPGGAVFRSPGGLFIIASVIALAASGVTDALAAWPSGPDSSLVVGAGSGDLGIASGCDGAGGVIVAWAADGSSCDPTTSRVRAQRLDVTGSPQWSLPDVALRSGVTLGGGQNWPAMATDGSGGAFVAWMDGCEGQSYWEIRLQHLDAEGHCLWGSDGVIGVGNLDWTDWQVCSYPRLPDPVLISDGRGGVIFLFTDTNSIYAQRVTAAGDVVWGSRGIQVPVPAGDDVMSGVIDGSGGAFILGGNGLGLWIQHLDLNGAASWLPWGTRFGVGASVYANTPEIAGAPVMVTDGAGGAIVSWPSYDAATSATDVWTQRFDRSGAAVWDSSGVTVCHAIGSQVWCTMVGDGAGGATVAWSDQRGGAGVPRIFGQRIMPNGLPAWAADGIPLSDAASPERYPTSSTTGPQGTVTVWQDSIGVRAQRLDSLGHREWGANGALVASSAGNRARISVLATDTGGAFVFWRDGLAQLRAQYVDPSGHVAGVGPVSPTPAGGATLVIAAPNPTNAPVDLRFVVDRSQSVSLTIHDVAGRQIRRLDPGAVVSGAHSKRWDLKDDAGSTVRPGIYFARLRTAATIRTVGITVVR